MSLKLSLILSFCCTVSILSACPETPLYSCNQLVPGLPGGYEAINGQVLMPKKHVYLLIVVTALHLLVFAFVLPGSLYGDQPLGGDQHYFRYASRIVRGEMPYRDFFLEYPTFALVPFTLPRLFSASPFVWERLYTWQMLFWDLLGIGFLSWASLQLGRSLVYTLGVYTLGLLAVGPLITQRFDLVPAVFSFMALTAYFDGRYKVAWGALILSVLTKAYAVVLVPLFLIDLVARRQFREIAFGLALLTLSALAILTAITILSPQAIADFLRFHQQRGAEIESIYANVGLLVHVLGSVPLQTSYEFMSVNASSPLVDSLVRYSLPLTLAGLLSVYVLYYRSQKDRQSLLNYAICSILIFVVFNKVLSPQYLIWLLPLIPITGLLLAGGLFVLAAALTTMLYPMNFGDLISAAPWAVGTLTVRNGFLLGLMMPLLRRGRTGPRAELEWPQLTGVMRRLDWLILVGFVLAFPLLFFFPAPPNPTPHLPPDLDGDGTLSERELYVSERGGVDYDSDGTINDVERRVLQTSGLDANGDGLIDGEELRFYLREGPP